MNGTGVLILGGKRQGVNVQGLCVLILFRICETITFIDLIGQHMGKITDL